MGVGNKWKHNLHFLIYTGFFEVCMLYDIVRTESRKLYGTQVCRINGTKKTTVRLLEKTFNQSINQSLG